MRVFITGASGHLGSAIVPELIGAGHEVVGLARSAAAAAAVTALGATVRRGDLDDLEGLAQAAADCDGVIHLAFKHEQMLSGDYVAAVAADLAVVHALGDALAGTGKPLVGTSGTLALANLGRPGTEGDAGNPGGRTGAENAVTGFAQRGVRSSVVRVPPITHGPLDRHGFARALIAIARKTGVAGYPGDGANRWPAGHTLDVSHLYRLALEGAPAGTRWHAAGDEGIPVREIAEAIAGHLGVPAVSIPAGRLQEHFGFLATLITLDNPTSTRATRRVLGWEPVHPGLLADFDSGDYFTAPAQDAAWLDWRMTTGQDETRVVSASREIAAAPEPIFELIADPSLQPRWDGNDNLAEAAAGQRVRRPGEMFRMTLTTGDVRENHVTEFEEGRRIAWTPAEPGKTPPGHLWRWELSPAGTGRTKVTCTYDWTRLTDANRFARARATTADKLLASIDRLATLAGES